MTAVFLDYDRAALDAQYDNRRKVADFQRHFDAWARDGERARALPGARIGVRYGERERETLNVFPAGAGAPVVVYVHGGYWMLLSAAASDYVALGLVPHGVAVVNVEYTLMPAVRMDTVVAQVRAAIAWTFANAASFGGDPGRVWIAGHSAGGHLTAMAALTDWAAQPGVPAGLRPRGGLSISGLHDLEPIRQCYLNDTLRMDAAEAARNTPLAAAPPVDGDWTVMVGAAEGPEYLRQAVALGAAWGSDERRRVRMEVVGGADHFSIVAPFADPASAMSRRVAAMVGSAAG